MLHGLLGAGNAERTEHRAQDKAASLAQTEMCCMQQGQRRAHAAAATQSTCGSVRSQATQSTCGSGRAQATQSTCGSGRAQATQSTHDVLVLKDQQHTALGSDGDSIVHYASGLDSLLQVWASWVDACGKDCCVWQVRLIHALMSCG